ncbi:sirohydrochlorin chelatase [Thermoanaerobacterium sp. DL9XJH110]|uniref:sirohydrochlorin chelatase n=1 Tax=Thermoanaerobacterium sp. DL9XJH110 TaxID=3386643 RepID=UPI003BB75245
MKRALLVLAHGSKAEGTQDVIFKVRERIKFKNIYDDVRVAFLQFNRPGIKEAIEGLYKDGIKDIVTVPMFLFEGNHIIHDIPQELKKAKEAHPDFRISLAKPIGYDERIVDIITERAEGEQWEI